MKKVICMIALAAISYGSVCVAMPVKVKAPVDTTKKTKIKDKNGKTKIKKKMSKDSTSTM
jgi:hypothetical protein